MHTWSNVDYKTVNSLLALVYDQLVIKCTIFQRFVTNYAVKTRVMEVSTLRERNAYFVNISSSPASCSCSPSCSYF